MMKKYWNSSRSELLQRVGSIEQIAFARRVMLLDGRAKSVEAVEVDTGSGFAFTLLPDRCLDMADARWCGRSLCWQSSAGVTNPAFYDREGGGWLRGFGGGLVVTCGLRNVGPSITESGESFGLHGEVSFAPAENVALRKFWEGDRYFMEVSGDVREAYPFGPNLRLQRTWRTELGANWVELEDTVTNEGHRAELHMHLYHCNFGFPLISETTQLEMSTDTVTPRDAAAARGAAEWNRFEAPSADFEEQVHFHSYSADSPERSFARILPDGANSDWGVELSYPTALLPDLTQWRCCRMGEYVLGIEPGNCRPEGRQAHRARKAQTGGTILAPGASANFQMRLSILDGPRQQPRAFTQSH